MASPNQATAPPATETSSRETILLDNFEDLSGWSVVTSPGARLEIAQDDGIDGRRAMRLDFEFAEGASFVIARKVFRLPLPENFVFRYAMRGVAPRSDAEFKIVDSRQNVWWFKQRDHAFSSDWQPVAVRKRHLQRAWGPGGSLEEVAVIEFALSANELGKGSIWIDELTFEEREPLHTYTLNPSVRASTSSEGHPPAAVLNTDPTASWRSGALAENQWLLLDFLTPREYGGLIIDWDADDYATDYQVQISDDGEQWETRYTVRDGNGERDYLYLPDVESRYVRLNLERSSRRQGYAIRQVAVQSYEFSTSPNQFFEAIARAAPRGWYPRYFQGEQSYWTVVGVSGDGKEALLSEDGALEVDKSSFTIEPFLFANGRLIAWADVEPVQDLAEGYLPIPTVRWELEHFWFAVTAFAAGPPGKSALYARYRVENLNTEIRHLTLFLVVRPFQVNPPWQSLNISSGVAPIRGLHYADRILQVNPSGKNIFVLTTPDRFRAATFDQGPILADLAAGRLPRQERVEDAPFGYASGVLEYGWDLPPGESREVYLRIPFHDRLDSAPTLPDADAAAQANQLLEQTRRDWATRLDRVALELPPVAQRLANSIKSNLAYIFINRDGPAIQPGSRAYARSWIRDGALTSAALLGMGYTEEVRQFLQWYAPYQFPDGKVPCCVDGRGADPTAEHDSHGELIYAIMEYYRYTRDVGFLREMWPYALKAVGYIDFLRQQRSNGKYRIDPEYIPYGGLVPESISHEGYASQPQHSYWDNFFTLRGLKDAAAMATILGEDAEAERISALRDGFRRDLWNSLDATLHLRQIDFIPGAVELGDFDPTSTTIAIDPGGELGWLPQPALNRTFERYLEFFQQRRQEQTWEAYTPYEWRSVGALIRLGLRDQALEALNFFLEGQRPAAWNHWAEVVWREPRLPRFIGDMPHTWVGSDFIRAVRSLFVYEREADRALVIGAGIPAAWVESPEGVGVKRMPTWHGTLNYRMAMADADTLKVRLSGDVIAPPGGIMLYSPVDRPLREVTVNGQPVATFTDRTVTLSQFPAEVELRY
ncbi:MAG: discoidin domain-containing protein [Candidatus Competibacteraceae bacterium]|nr:discoidin domain-containing protein [Candidatus Competibacteraceae bacterium]MCB1820159.1 discoidin domain-containing protein [Candidatus Competibacteraceae bacterium]